MNFLLNSARNRQVRDRRTCGSQAAGGLVSQFHSLEPRARMGMIHQKSPSEASVEFQGASHEER